MEQNKSMLNLKELLISSKLNAFTRLDSVYWLPHGYESLTNVSMYLHYDLMLII